MTLDELSTYILDHYEASSGHPDKDDPTITVFMRPDNKKWFAATKNIGRRFLGVDGSGRIDILNVKLSPRTVASLRTHEGFMPAWHMNQNNWVTILLDGSVADEEVFRVLDQAFAGAAK